MLSTVTEFMGTTERRERQRVELREKILAAAREMFAREGYEAVTMRRIAERIEYSPTAIYGHFPDKEALVRELCDRDFLALAQQFLKLARVEDPVERLIQAGHAYAAFGVAHPYHYQLMFMTPDVPAKAAGSRLERGNPQQDAYAFVRAVVAECMEAGLMREDLKDVDLVAQVVWAAIHGVVALQVARAKDDWIPWRPYKKRVALSIDTMVRGLAREGRRG